MIVTLIVLIPLLTGSLLAFFKLSPKGSDIKKIRIYNLCTILVAILLSIIFSFRVEASMMKGGDFRWWPIIFMVSPIVSIGTIFISGILRNFIIFRNTHR